MTERATDGARAFRNAVLIFGVGMVVALVWMGMDAAQRRRGVQRSEGVRAALVRATGLADPFLSSSSRWLRYPSLAEPAAAHLDAPDGIDVDPGGMAIGGYTGPREPGRLGRARP